MRGGMEVYEMNGAVPHFFSAVIRQSPLSPAEWTSTSKNHKRSSGGCHRERGQVNDRWHGHMAGAATVFAISESAPSNCAQQYPQQIITFCSQLLAIRRQQAILQ